MGATVAFTDLGSLAGAGFPNTSHLADQQLHLQTEISSEHCFEDIVGKSSAIQKVLEQVAIVAPTDSTGPASRRNRNGEGADCAGDPQAQLSVRARLCAHELCGHSLGTAGKRTVRARKGGLYRGSNAKKGSIRGGGRRLAVSG